MLRVVFEYTKTLMIVVVDRFTTASRNVLSTTNPFRDFFQYLEICRADLEDSEGHIPVFGTFQGLTRVVPSCVHASQAVAVIL